MNRRLPLFDSIDTVESNFTPEETAYERAESMRAFGIPDERISLLLRSSKLPDVDYSTLSEPPSRETVINNLIGYWESERAKDKKITKDPLNHIDVYLRDLRREKADILREQNREFEAYLIDKEVNEDQKKYHQYYIDFLNKKFEKGFSHPNMQSILDEQIHSLEVVNEKIKNTQRPPGRDPAWKKYDALPDWASDDAKRLAIEGVGDKELSSQRRSKSQQERRAREKEERGKNRPLELFAKEYDTEENKNVWYPQISMPLIGDPDHNIENLTKTDTSDYDQRLQEWKDKYTPTDKPRRSKKKDKGDDGKLFRNVVAPRPELPSIDVGKNGKKENSLINQWFKKHKPPRYA